MMDALITLAGLISLFAWFVLVGVAFFKFERYRTNTKLLRCPETEGVTLVELDTRASSAAAHGSSSIVPKLRVYDCRLWPERQGCGRKCLERSVEPTLASFPLGSS